MNNFEKEYYVWRNLECYDLPNDGIKINIKTWYPGWLIKLLVRWAIRKYNKDE